MRSSRLSEDPVHVWVCAVRCVLAGGLVLAVALCVSVQSRWMWRSARLGGAGYWSASGFVDT
jgi:hypothetical protein